MYLLNNLAERVVRTELSLPNITEAKKHLPGELGDTISTKGYSTPGDGGAAHYRIVADGTFTDGVDGESADGSFLQGNGFQLELLPVNINPMQFGAAGDAVTVDTVPVENMLFFHGKVATVTEWRGSAGNTHGPTLHCWGLGKVYAMDREIELEAENTALRMTGFNFIAVGNSWETAGGTATTEREFYRPNHSDYFFKGKANATYITFEGCYFNCNNRCGGVALRSRCRVNDCFITKCSGIGVEGLSGDVWVSRTTIAQWGSADVEYYDKDAYTGVGVFSEDSDMRVSNCVIRWLHECVRFEGTNHNIWDSHIFNGMKGFLAADRSQSAEEITAMAAYHGISEAAVPTTDFTVRDYHAGIVTSGSDTQDNSFSDVYFDNCHNEHYSDRVHYINPKLGSKAGSSIGVPQHWWQFHCHTDQAEPEFVIEGIQILVESVVRDLILMSGYNGNQWKGSYNNFESSEYNKGSSEHADGIRIGKPQINVPTESGGANRPAVIYYGIASRCFVGFADSNTTVDGNNDPIPIKYGCRGDNALVRASGLIVESEDGNDENFQIDQHGVMTLRALAAEPTASNGALALSDGTSSTNGFGTSGAGLYHRSGGSWTKL